MANADRIEVGDIIGLYELGDAAGVWEDCMLLDHPSRSLYSPGLTQPSSFPCWIVRLAEGMGRVLYIPASKVYVELIRKKVRHVK